MLARSSIASIAVLVGLLSALPAAAQPARSPQQLAELLRQAMQSNDGDLIERIVHKGAEPASIQRLKSMAATIGKDNRVQAHAIPADDREAVAREEASYPVRGMYKPLATRLQEAAERGFRPTLAPIGDIVLFIGPAAECARGMKLNQMYGESGGVYYIVFNVRS